MSINSYKPKWKRRDYLGPAGREAAIRAEKNLRQSQATAASRKKNLKSSRATSTKSKSWLKPRTAKRAAEEAIYRRRVKERLANEKPICAVAEVVGSTRIQRATQVHHVFGRRGKLLLWEPGWKFVSMDGHLWIENNKKLARQLGLLAPVGKYNDQSLVTT